METSEKVVEGGGGGGGGGGGEWVPVAPPASKLIHHRLLDAPDELDRNWYAHFYYMRKMLSELDEANAMKELQRKCQEENQYNEMMVGLFYGILSDSRSAQVYYRYLTLICTDNYEVCCTYLKRIIMEKYFKLLDPCRTQVLWLIRELITRKVAQVDNVIICLLRNIVGGDVSSKNIWLTNTLVDILEQHKPWLLTRSTLITYVFHTLARCSMDHGRPQHVPLRDKEAALCTSLWQENRDDVAILGRELVRILHETKDIPGFSAMWKELRSIPDPSSIEDMMEGPITVSKLMSIRTPRAFLQARLTPDMEDQLRFLMTHVNLGDQKRYQQWFASRFLHTPDSESLIPDLVRYICCVYHPSNAVLQSRVIPRWAVLGWLLKCCKRPENDPKIKLALFIDYLYYDKSDNFMNIEPGLLLMTQSLKSYPDITLSLLQYLMFAVESFAASEFNRQIMRKGVSLAFASLVKKGVVPTLNPLREFPALSKLPHVKSTMAKLFPEHFDESYVPPPSPPPSQDVPTIDERCENATLSIMEERRMMNEATSTDVNGFDRVEALLEEGKKHAVVAVTDSLPTEKNGGLMLAYDSGLEQSAGVGVSSSQVQPLIQGVGVGARLGTETGVAAGVVAGVGSGAGVAAGVGSGAGVAAGVGSGVAAGVGSHVGIGAGVAAGVGSGVGIGAGVGVGIGAGVGAVAGSGVAAGVGAGFSSSGWMRYANELSSPATTKTKNVVIPDQEKTSKVALLPNPATLTPFTEDKSSLPEETKSNDASMLPLSNDLRTIEKELHAFSSTYESSNDKAGVSTTFRAALQSWLSQANAMDIALDFGNWLFPILEKEMIEAGPIADAAFTAVHVLFTEAVSTRNHTKEFASLLYGLYMKNPVVALRLLLHSIDHAKQAMMQDRTYGSTTKLLSTYFSFLEMRPHEHVRNNHMVQDLLLCQEADDASLISKSMTSPMTSLVSSNPSLFMAFVEYTCKVAIPFLCRHFPNMTVGNQALVKFVTSQVSPAQLHDLCCRITLQEFQLIGTVEMRLLVTSLEWESFEQYCLWEIIVRETEAKRDASNVHPPDTDQMVSTLRKTLACLDPEKHLESLHGMSGLMRVLAPDSSILRCMFNLSSKFGSFTESVVLQWLSKYPDTLRAYILSATQTPTEKQEDIQVLKLLDRLQQKLAHPIALLHHSAAREALLTSMNKDPQRANTFLVLSKTLDTWKDVDQPPSKKARV